MQNKNQNTYTIVRNKENNTLIIPIFIPFWACPQICVFCNQALQTGANKEENTLSSLDNLNVLLEKAKDKIYEYKKLYPTKKLEIAFYGGTFSALPEVEFEYALKFLKNLKDKIIIAQARCSTRPDACDTKRLIAMKEAGIDTIELGIQSFSTKALLASNRGYTENEAMQGCKLVKEHGFKLGVQLMPNMPAQEIADFYADIEKVIEIKPDFIRLYPCLVVENTPLAKMWKEGRHTVWDTEGTIHLLAFAMYKMWLNNILIIRVGVAPEIEFYKKVLAGVHNDSLGQSVQIKAFKLLIKDIIEEHSLNTKNIIWHFPLHTKGYIMLQKDSFWNEYNINSNTIIWHDKEQICFEIK